MSGSAWQPRGVDMVVNIEVTKAAGAESAYYEPEDEISSPVFHNYIESQVFNQKRTR